MIMKVLVDEQLVCSSEDKAGKSMVEQLHLDLPKALAGGQRDLVTSILWATVSALRDVLDLVETFRESGGPNVAICGESPQDGLVGTPISRKQAIDIANSILADAESARRDAAEAEAAIGLDYANEKETRNMSEVKYPLKLVVETLHFCCWSNPVTENMQLSHIKARLAEIYGVELVEQAHELLRGEHSPASNEKSSSVVSPNGKAGGLR